MFIRGLWGNDGLVIDMNNRRERLQFRNEMQRPKITNDILLSAQNKFEVDYMTYVFGTNNYDYLTSLGIKCKLIDKRSVVWDLKTENYRHKLEIIKCGAYDYDEIVFLDWDTQVIKPVDDNFWLNLSKKYAMQACLRRYKKNIRAVWRKMDQEFVPCASFVYLRDKSLCDKAIEYWSVQDNRWSEELSLARVTDDLMGGWQGLEKYFECCEPSSFGLSQLYRPNGTGACNFRSRDPSWAFSPSKMASKVKYFDHFWSDIVKDVLDHPEFYRGKDGFLWVK